MKEVVGKFQQPAVYKNSFKTELSIRVLFKFLVKHLMWFYQHSVVRCLQDLPDHEDLFGFCYKITNLRTGSIYIGKKQFYSARKKKLAKKERDADKRKKLYKIEVKESDWMDYWGSNKELQEDIRQSGTLHFKREILALAFSKKYLSYLEIKYQFQFDVLGQNTYNKNILGRFYPRDIEINEQRL
jgi:hypothetical protein